MLGRDRPRRGILAHPRSAPPVATGRLVVRVWLALVFFVGSGWLVASGRLVVPTTWAEGTIASRYVYAPVDCSYQVPALDPAGRPTVKTFMAQRGELIVAKGQRVTAEQAACLRVLAATMPATTRARERWGVWAMVVVIGLAGGLLLRWTVPTTIARTNHLILVGALTLLTVGWAHLILYGSTWPIWATPMAGQGMLLTLLLNPTVAMVTTVITSWLVGLMAGQHLTVTLSVTIGGLVGILAVQGARRRGHLLRAGALSGAAQGLACVVAGALEHLPLRTALWEGFVYGGCWSGLGSFVMTIALLPVLENLFGVITDITLLELSDLNHPLLKELSLRAPGTYHHSLVVAVLAEQGCEAIGANGLLARVGCYFHDIGKMPKADYFVENLPAGRSRHDRLSPSMSSLIIINHVKEGIELARAHRINPAIMDFIPGHHGTGLIYYFYRRALEQVEDERLLKEENFRYAGPKPRTREIAVAMLADSVEAACRALPEHTPARLTGGVRRIINNKFIDGQLNDCTLTLQDLERIAEAFVRVLTGMYHSRVAYPVPPGEDVEDRELHAGADLRPSAPPVDPHTPPEDR